MERSGSTRGRVRTCRRPPPHGRAPGARTLPRPRREGSSESPRRKDLSPRVAPVQKGGRPHLPHEMATKSHISPTARARDRAWPRAPAPAPAAPARVRRPARRREPIRARRKDASASPWRPVRYWAAHQQGPERLPGRVPVDERLELRHRAARHQVVRDQPRFDARGRPGAGRRSRSASAASGAQSENSAYGRPAPSGQRLTEHRARLDFLLWIRALLPATPDRSKVKASMSRSARPRADSHADRHARRQPPEDPGAAGPRATAGCPRRTRRWFVTPKAMDELVAGDLPTPRA